MRRRAAPPLAQGSRAAHANVVGHGRGWLRVRWIAALFAVILALPIVGITLYFTHDVQGRIAAARSERAGLAHVALLQAFLTDSEAFAQAVICPAGGDLEALRTKAAADLAAIDAFQARGGAPPRWPKSSPRGARSAQHREKPISRASSTRSPRVS